MQCTRPLEKAQLAQNDLLAPPMTVLDSNELVLTGGWWASRNTHGRVRCRTPSGHRAQLPPRLLTTRASVQ
eukprot:6214421-Pleurochrysis_carterae.AAC.1